MKSSILVLAIALISWACISTPEQMDFDIKRSDSISEVGRKFIIKQDTLYEKEYAHLLDDLHSFRDSAIERSFEVQCSTDTVYQTKEVVRYVEVPVYKKIVYSIFTSRGAHVSVDTLN